MEPDESGRRPGGPRRAPMSRPAPRRPAPRRTSGGRPAPVRRQRTAGGAARGGRPGPAPRPAPYPEADHREPDYPEPARPGPEPSARRPGKRGGKPNGGGGPKIGGRPKSGAKGTKGANTRKGGNGKGSGWSLADLGPKAYFAAAGVLAAVVLLGFGGLAIAGGADGADARGAALPPMGTAAETGLSPTSYSSSPSSEAYAGIESRNADAEPLTIEEAFPENARAVAVPDSEVELELAAKKLDADCAAAVWGDGVASVLRAGGCSQAVRGLYADTDSGYGLAVAVFNLASAADADRFVAKLGESLGGGFVRPLQAEAPLDEFGAGFGMARGLAQGHFAVVSWAARLDGTGDAADETLLSLLIEGGKAPAVLARAARTSE